jgi:serine/threonine-protein phosphatase 2B catalytic subunit
MESFEAMPISATVNNKYFCVHGGISPDMLKIDDIN